MNIDRLIDKKEKRLIRRFIVFALCVIFTVSASGCSGKGHTPESPQTSSFNENASLKALAPTISPEELPTIEFTPEIIPTPDVLTSPDVSVSEDVPVSLMVGYWCSIFQGLDGVDHLSGFYFAADGTGLIFHSSEGSMKITSYSYSDNELVLHFLNLGDEPVDWLYQVDSLSENELILSHGFYGDEYTRMLKIAPYNCTGGYTVTQLDGTVFDIIGY